MKAFTHGGIFHADDVFSSALLRIVYPDIVISRGFKLPEDSDIVFDIGGGEFDHHSEPRECRENGIPYAAFGKLWAVYGPQLVGDEYKHLDENFVQPLDLADNGGQNNPLSIAISAQNPLWDCPENPDACFEKAVEFALPILDRIIQSAQSRNRSREIAESAISQDGQIAILESFAPIIGQLVGSNKAFLVYPSLRGGWNAQVVPISSTDRTATIPFPHEWWGASKEKLPRGVTFCHSSGFLIAADDQKSAIAACEEAIDRNENYEKWDG